MQGVLKGPLRGPFNTEEEVNLMMIMNHLCNYGSPGKAVSTSDFSLKCSAATCQPLPMEIYNARIL
jgi:hypothetical protein